jgi:hypothetical protein
MQLIPSKSTQIDRAVFPEMLFGRTALLKEYFICDREGSGIRICLMI